MAVGLVSGIAYVTLAITVAFNVLKIIIGILGIKKSEVMGSNNFFMIWGIVFLIFGVFGLAGTFSLIGFCNLMAGIAAPLLYIIFSKQTKAA